MWKEGKGKPELQRAQARKGTGRHWHLTPLPSRTPAPWAFLNTTTVFRAWRVDNIGTTREAPRQPQKSPAFYKRSPWESENSAFKAPQDVLPIKA